MGSEAAIPAPAADAASGEGSPAIGSRDEGQAKEVIAQPAEPSVDAEKNSPAGKTSRYHEVGDSSVAVEFDGAAVDPLREASAALDDRDYATAQRLFAAIDGKTLLKLSRTHWRPSIARTMRRLRGFLRRSARKAPLPRR
jgi:hypothetical protein